jgi:methylenetetrahydrofolate reductase (NADPH)
LQFSEIHRASQLVISFELFPPKTPEGETRLFERAIPEMLKLRPAFLTCTYGAGGSTREKTMEIVSRIKRDFPIEAASHLTCLGGSREDIRRYLAQARAVGVNNIVALRGDPPKDRPDYLPLPGGFRLGRELVEFIKEVGGFGLAVAGYPEGHPECPDKYLDWERLAEKVKVGADVVITQLFYNNRDFFTMRDYLRYRLGVTAPIVAGVLPILSTSQIMRFCGICGAKLPPWVMNRLEAYAHDDRSAREYGIELATAMCAELIRNGVDGLHFYTLNHSESTAAVLRDLSLA